MVSRHLCPRIPSYKYASIFFHQRSHCCYDGGRKNGWSHETYILDFHHRSLRKYLLPWSVWYQYICVTNGSGKWIALGPKYQLCLVEGNDDFGKWTTLGYWGAMESGTGLSLLSELHTVILWFLVLWNCSGRRVD